MRVERAVWIEACPQKGLTKRAQAQQPRCARRTAEGGCPHIFAFHIVSPYFLNCGSISTWYPVTILLVSLAMPTTAISSLNMASVIPFFCADTVCEAMQ